MGGAGMKFNALSANYDLNLQTNHIEDFIAAKVDLIVLGAHGQTLGTGLMRTSIADHVLSHAHCAVLIAKPPVAPRRIEVPAAPHAR